MTGRGNHMGALLQLGRSLELTELGMAITERRRPNPLGRPVRLRCLRCTHRLAGCTCQDARIAARAAS
jgi:hypothetical protein